MSKRCRRSFLCPPSVHLGRGDRQQGPDRSLGNPGSADHPNCRPCVFHYRNCCASGDSCDYCHHPAHNGRRKLKASVMEQMCSSRSHMPDTSWSDRDPGLISDNKFHACWRPCGFLIVSQLIPPPVYKGPSSSYRGLLCYKLHTDDAGHVLFFLVATCLP